MIQRNGQHCHGRKDSWHRGRLEPITSAQLPGSPHNRDTILFANVCLAHVIRLNKAAELEISNLFYSLKCQDKMLVSLVFIFPKQKLYQ